LITLFLSEWIIEIEEGKPKFMGYPKDWLKTLEDKNFKEEILFYHNFFDK
jgi:hypothetical protein